MYLTYTQQLILHKVCMMALCQTLTSTVSLFGYRSTRTPSSILIAPCLVVGYKLFCHTACIFCVEMKKMLSYCNLMAFTVSYKSRIFIRHFTLGIAGNSYTPYLIFTGREHAFKNTRLGYSWNVLFLLQPAPVSSTSRLAHYVTLIVSPTSRLAHYVTLIASLFFSFIMFRYGAIPHTTTSTRRRHHLDL